MTEFNPDLKAYLLAQAREADIPLDLGNSTLEMMLSFDKEMFMLCGCQNEFQANQMLAALKTWKELEASQQVSIEKIDIHDPWSKNEHIDLVGDTRLGNLESMLDKAAKTSVFVFLCGPSGCGKTTSAQALARWKPEKYRYVVMHASQQSVYEPFRSEEGSLTRWIHQDMTTFGGNSVPDEAFAVDSLRSLQSCTATFVAVQCGLLGASAEVHTPDAIASRINGESRWVLIDEAQGDNVRYLRNVLLAAGFKVALFGTNARVANLVGSVGFGSRADGEPMHWCHVYFNWPPAEALANTLNAPANLSADLSDYLVAEMMNTWPLVASDIHRLTPELLDPTVPNGDNLSTLSSRIGSLLTKRKRLVPSENWLKGQRNLFLHTAMTPLSPVFINDHYARLSEPLGASREGFDLDAISSKNNKPQIRYNHEIYKPRSCFPCPENSSMFHLSMMRGDDHAAVNDPFYGYSVWHCFNSDNEVQTAVSNHNAQSADGDTLEACLVTCAVQASRRALTVDLRFPEFFGCMLGELRPKKYQQEMVTIRNQALRDHLNRVPIPCCPAANCVWPDRLLQVSGPRFGNILRPSNNDRVDAQMFHSRPTPTGDTVTFTKELVLVMESKNYIRTRFTIKHLYAALARSQHHLYVLFTETIQPGLGKNTAWCNVIRKVVVDPNVETNAEVTTRLNGTRVLIVTKQGDGVELKRVQFSGDGDNDNLGVFTHLVILVCLKQIREASAASS